MGTYWGEENGTQVLGLENLKNLEDLGVDGRTFE